ncbi:uncharacterized protein CANTADRAFT_124628 [Suhomyces tanzawaensis NRRL Y-17324]|uniref:S-adenosyl-L-methionine-dependent methyltransferase n=1 Tax=Suhomyces tanzawaensis NRRL Y-17324 TaxID=984487 RepID=A0A1E4SQQ3_9ASCO|nr:uncharacterized protein CANTADRAFT_124628 [Suhomyces tanzawaensis NRRL Y-17324]ODV81843.1 hypothetical protein CANTADRAFT_124628 [Suhomyces tanzawaensis NRRL Y-17324]
MLCALHINRLRKFSKVDSNYTPDPRNWLPVCTQMARKSSFQLLFPRVSQADLLDRRPELLQNCKRRKTSHHHHDYDFSKAANQYDYNEAIVQEYFDVPNYTLSRVNLCPTVTSRLEYLRLVELRLAEPVEIVRETVLQSLPAPRYVVDIGTGASVIFPVVGLALNDTTRFIATETDTAAMSYAQQVVAADPRLASRITLVLVEPHDALIPVESVEAAVAASGGSVRYTVCNPPFYEDARDLQRREAGKSRKPNELTASASELYCAGGEVAFVSRLVDQSLELRHHASFAHTWYTSMVGIREHVDQIQAYWTSHGITNTWVQGYGATTRRWIVAWATSGAVDPGPPVYRAPRPELAGERPAVPAVVSAAPTPAIPSTYQTLVANYVSAQLARYAQTHAFEYLVMESQAVYVVTRQPVWLRRFRRRPRVMTPVVIRVAEISPIVVHMAYNQSGEDLQAIITSLSQILAGRH